MPDGKEKSPLAKYDEAAEYAYYDYPLREALKKKNPVMFERMVKEKQDAYNKHATDDHSPFAFFDVHKIIPKMMEEGWKDSLSEDEIKDIFSKLTPVDGQDPYQRFMELRKNKELGGGIYGMYNPTVSGGYSPTDLAVQPTTSWADDETYYKPEIKDGKLVRKTNLGMNMEEAFNKFLQRTKGSL